MSGTTDVALGEQAVAALGDLVHGLRAADAVTTRTNTKPDALGRSLVTAVLRMIVLLYAEDRGTLPDRALGALLDRLHAAEAASSGSLSGRYGAWGEVLALFTAMGAAADPLLGAPVDDATVLRVLARLTVSDGAPIAYRDLDLDGIGGAYEALIGLGVAVTRGRSIALRPDHVLVDLDDLLARPGPERVPLLTETAGCEVTGRAAVSLARAASVDALLAVLMRRASPRTDAALPAGVLALAPTAERRRSGSHYTPHSITSAVVEGTLAPLLDGADPESILALRVCDPAMGCGAFLLEVCRFLGDRLLVARGEHVGDEAIVDRARTMARRAVAESCLRGVDKDPLAVDLARLSLWLLACTDGPPLAFLGDHLLCGDSLVGARRDDLRTYPRAALRRDDATKGEQVALRAFERRCAAELAVLGPFSPAPSNEGPSELGRRLDAWLALWFWPVGADPPKRGQATLAFTAAEPAVMKIDAPTPAGFEAYLAAAARADPVGPHVQRASAIARRERFLHWEAAFPDVFQRRDGFDAIVGNPPWVAYAGRAAQPLAADAFNFHLRTSPAFFGYRTLHGLFIHRAATLLRAGGRLGFVVPTSVSDLEGYGPARAAHDALCEPDIELPDFGARAFAGVFQPAMGLLSTRRGGDTNATPPPAAVWRIARTDIDADAERLLARLSSYPPLPPSLFGERGYQTSGADPRLLRAFDATAPTGFVPVREGRDIGAFVAHPPRLCLDPRGVEGRLRPAEQWKEVKLLIRQTARFPIAALSDGQAFRNSILAGFASDAHSAFFLLCYLNATPIRWLHYARNRDARQGMPQVKIAHLRGVPEPPRLAEVAAELDALGRAVGERNAGLREEERVRIDGLVALALAIGEGEMRLIDAWAQENPAPQTSRALPAPRGQRVPW